jgi:predicted permease
MRLFWRRSDRDFADEIEAHLALEADRLRAEGVSEHEARARAARAFGNPTAARESFYESRRAPVWDAVVRDLRYACRGLARRPGFAAAAILTLALGIGANTAIFSAVDEALFRPPDVPGADRLAHIYRFNRKTSKYVSTSYPDYDDFRRQARSFQNLAAYARLALTVQWTPDDAERMAVETVSGNYFAMLRAAPRAGRILDVGDDVPSASPVAMISDDLWRTKFHSDPAVPGRAIEIAGASFTIVGVAPSSVSGLNLDWLTPPKIWIPLRTAGLVVPRMAALKIFDTRAMIWLVLTGRLRPDATPASAEAELQAISTRIAIADPAQRDLTAAVMPLSRSKFWPAYRKGVGNSLTAFAIAAGLILLLACANVSNLLVGRAIGRRREMAMRLAIGAGRAQLVRQLLTESAVLALASCLASVAVATVLMRLLRQFPDALGLPLSLELTVEPRALAFCAAISLLTIALCGLAPALWTARLDVVSSLKCSGHGGGGAGQEWLRGGLIAAQAAFSMILLVGGGLYGRTLWNAYSADLGFRSDHLLTAAFSLPAPGSDIAARTQDAQRALLRELPSIAGVQSATISSAGILSRVHPSALVRNTPQDPPISAGCEFVARDYMRTLGVRLASGRDFAERDEGGATAIVNETLALALGGRGAGETVWVEAPGRKKLSMTIVGVAKDGRYGSVWEQPEPHIYLAAAKSDVAVEFLAVRTGPPPQSLAEPIRKLWAGLSPTTPLYDTRTGDEAVRLFLTPQRVAAGILGGFGVLSMALTGVGLYSVIAFSLAQRTREIGIRIAIGASPRAVGAAVAGGAARWVIAGVAAGAVGSASTMRLLAANVKGVSLYDAPTYGAAALLLACIAAAACFVPARRAVRVDPSSALRSE